MGTFPELTQKAYCLSLHRREALIHKVIDSLPNMNGDETVVETGTFYTAYWGEILAKKLMARHIVIYLDEHNVGIHEEQADFFRFKYEREELACISDEAYHDIFSPFWEYQKERSYTLPCYCTNSLEDINSPVIDETKKAEYTIGYVGRLEKDAFQALVDGLMEFASSHPQKAVALNCFGGYDNPSECNRLQVKLAEYPNVGLYVSGFLFPIPKRAVEKCDIFFASAGSVTVPVKAGVPTISMNVYSNCPDGFRIDARNRFVHIKCDKCRTVADYLETFFTDGFRPQMEKYNLEEEKILFDEYLCQHVLFLERAMKRPLDYYDISKMDMTLKERVKKLINKCRYL